MGADVDILTFVEGESLQFTLAAKDRDGTVLDSAASAGIEFSLAAKRDDAGSPDLTFTLTDSEVTLQDASTAVFAFDIPAASYSALTPGKTYYYDIYTTVGTSVLHQIGGRFRIQRGAKS